MPVDLTAFHFIFLPLLGLFVGTLGTLIGAGGGFIVVPVLLVMFPETPPETITSISLTVVFLNAASGTLGYLREKRIDFRSGVILTLTALPAAIGGALVTGYIPRNQFEVLFGFAMLAGGAYMWWKRNASAHGGPGNVQNPNRRIVDADNHVFEYRINEPAAAVASPAAGFISSLLGIGGGIVHVPVMIIGLRVPPPIATATSHFVLVFLALSGVLTHVATGNFEHGWRRAGLIGVGALIGAQIASAMTTLRGCALSQRTNAKTQPENA